MEGISHKTKGMSCWLLFYSFAGKEEKYWPAVYIMKIVMMPLYCITSRTDTVNEKD